MDILFTIFSRMQRPVLRCTCPYHARVHVHLPSSVSDFKTLLLTFSCWVVNRDLKKMFLLVTKSFHVVNNWKLDHWFLKLFPNRSRVTTMTRNPCLPFSWTRATHTKEFPTPAKHRVLFAQALGKTQCFLHRQIYLQRHRHFFQGSCQTISWACLASTWATQQGALQIIPSPLPG